MDRMEEHLDYGCHCSDRIQDNDLRLDLDSDNLDLVVDSLGLDSLDLESLGLNRGMVRLEHSERLVLECLDKDVHHLNHYFLNLMMAVVVVRMVLLYLQMYLHSNYLLK